MASLCDYTDSDGFEWVVDDSHEDAADMPDLSDTRVGESDPDPDDLSELENLMDASSYESFVGEEE